MKSILSSTFLTVLIVSACVPLNQTTQHKTDLNKGLTQNNTHKSKAFLFKPTSSKNFKTNAYFEEKRFFDFTSENGYSLNINFGDSLVSSNGPLQESISFEDITLGSHGGHYEIYDLEYGFNDDGEKIVTKFSLRVGTSHLEPIQYGVYEGRTVKTYQNESSFSFRFGFVSTDGITYTPVELSNSGVWVTQHTVRGLPYKYDFGQDNGGVYDCQKTRLVQPGYINRPETYPPPVLRGTIKLERDLSDPTLGYLKARLSFTTTSDVQENDGVCLKYNSITTPAGSLDFDLPMEILPTFPPNPTPTPLPSTSSSATPPPPAGIPIVAIPKPQNNIGRIVLKPSPPCKVKNTNNSTPYKLESIRDIDKSGGDVTLFFSEGPKLSTTYTSQNPPGEIASHPAPRGSKLDPKSVVNLYDKLLIDEGSFFLNQSQFDVALAKAEKPKSGFSKKSQNKIKTLKNLSKSTELIVSLDVNPLISSNESRFASKKTVTEVIELPIVKDSAGGIHTMKIKVKFKVTGKYAHKGKTQYLIEWESMECL